FFFSSRRRHTRFSRDWSSDVCSSDLNLFIRENTKLNPYKIADNERFLRTIEYIQDARIIVIPIPETDSVDLVVITKDLFSLTGRSEERRVGKECRYRWWWYEEKKEEE